MTEEWLEIHCDCYQTGEEDPACLLAGKPLCQASPQAQAAWRRELEKRWDADELRYDLSITDEERVDIDGGAA
jgi:hypothetical protein